MPLNRKMVILEWQQISKGKKYTNKVNEKVLNLIANLGHCK